MSGKTNGKVGKHAVVLGSSMSGLLAARVLSEHFEKVTVVERDALTDSPDPRKGAPQAQHIHVLMAKGAEILEQLFPGLFDELQAAGAVKAEMADAAWFHFGAWKARARTGVMAYLQSRGLLEWKVRQRVRAVANISFLERCDALGYLSTEDRSRITGVKLRRHGGEGEESLEGVELVVDASGRGSQTPRWLEQLGYPLVEESHVKVGMGYTTLVFQKPKDFSASWKILAIYPKAPEQRRFGYLSPIEHDRWICSLGGWLGEHAPLDEAGFLEFARSLPRPEIYEAIKNAQPVGPIKVHKFPSTQRRLYERMPRFPEGLAVLGDALCSLNPVYGQGMTLGALESMVLGECVGRGGLTGLAQRFRKEAAEVLATPFLMNVSEDFRYPEVEGPKPRGLGLIHWYGSHMHALAAHDPEVVKGFVNVMHMLKSPAALASPGMLWRVLTSRPPAQSIAPELQPPPPAPAP